MGQLLLSRKTGQVKYWHFTRTITALSSAWRQAWATLESPCESIYHVQRVGLKPMKTNPITVLILLFSAILGVPSAQANQAQGVELARSLDVSSCKGDFQSGEMVCESVLSRSEGTKRNKAGDRILMRTNFVTSSTGEPITALDASIVEVELGVKDRHALRIRIDKAVLKNGHELPVEAKIVAVASQSSVVEGWRFPVIIVDRFPHIPEDDERLPGERKLSEDQPRTTPLDSMAELPVHYRVVCPKKQQKVSVNPCTNLLEARGVYGYKAVTIEPPDSVLPAESVLSSKKNILFDAGTVLVLAVKNNPRSF
jgi:hypothetical protein